MPPHIAPRFIALVLLAAGVLSLALYEPLSRLDSLVSRSGPLATDKRRREISEWAIIGTGLALVALALVFVRLH